MDLNHARLPIPPLRRGKRTSVRRELVTWASVDCTSGSGGSPRATAGLAGRGIDFTLVIGSLLPVFLQLVVQRLEADAENLGSPSLVVVGRLKRLENQSPLGLADRRPDSEMNRIGCRGQERGRRPFRIRVEDAWARSWGRRIGSRRAPRCCATRERCPARCEPERRSSPLRSRRQP